MAEQSIQDLEQAAKYRPGAVSQIANLLTGGLYGMASGTTAKNVDAATARKFLLENRMQDIQQQRMLERINRNRSESMTNELLRIAEQDEATAKRQREADERQRMKKAPEMKGFLTAQPESAIRYPGLQNLDIDTLESMYSQAKAEEAQREDAAKRNSGYIQFNVPGYGTFSGTPERLAEIAKSNPLLADVMSGKTKPNKEEYKVSVRPDQLTGELISSVSFNEGVTPERRKEILADVFGTNAPSAAPKPAPGAPAQPVQPQPISIPGYTLKVK
jgi:hypothetical protein